MMGLMDEIRAVGVLKGQPCTVSLVLDQLSAADKADLVDAFADPAIPATRIELVLRNRGMDVRANALRRHRQKACSC